MSRNKSKSSLNIYNEDSLRRIEFTALVLARPDWYTDNDLVEYFNQSPQSVRRDAGELRKSGIQISSSKRKYSISKYTDKMLNDMICKYMALNQFDHIKNLKLIKKKFGGRTLLIFVNILKAIGKKHILVISYAKNENETVRKEVTPVSLTRTGREIYLIALENDNFEKPRVFRMDKINNVEFTKRKSANKHYPDIADLFRNSWGIYMGGKEYDVELRFDKQVGEDFKSKLYIESQDITEYPDYYLMKAKVKMSYEFMSWVLGWGGLVEIVKPVELKQEVLKKAGEIISRHQNGVAG